MVRAHEGKLAVHLDGGMLAALCDRPSLTETVKALGARLPSPVRATEREAAPHARAGDGGRRGGDFRRGRPDRRPHASAELTPEAKSPIGLISLGYQARSAFGVGLPFGRIEADALHALADISERRGDGSLRTTPWRALLLTGVSASDEMNLRDEVTALDLITDPADPRLNIFACVGAPSCLSASVDARGDAVRLAAAVGATRNKHAPCLWLQQILRPSWCRFAHPRRPRRALRSHPQRQCRRPAKPDSGLTIDQIEALLQSAKGQRP